MNWLDRFDDLLDRPVGTRPIAMVRIAVGLVAFVQLRPVALDALRGRTFHDRFFDPFLEPIPTLPPVAYTIVTVTGAIAAVAMAVGLVTRWATAATTLAVGAHLVSATAHLHNNRAYLFAVLVGLSLAPAGRSWSIDRWLAARRGGEPPPEQMAGWPVWLIRFECSLVYAASGFSKLVDPDWFGGTVTWGRTVTQEALVRASALPDGLQDLLLDRSFHSVAAKAIVLTELAIATGLWWRPTRWWAVMVAVAFHVSIELSASVETFSYLAIGVLPVWIGNGLDDAAPTPRWLRASYRALAATVRPASRPR